MDNNSKKATSSGVSLVDVVQIVFIILKLTNLITWPWKIVLIPLWIDLGLSFILLVVLLIIALCQR